MSVKKQNRKNSSQTDSQLSKQSSSLSEVDKASSESLFIILDSLSAIFSLTVNYERKLEQIRTKMCNFEAEVVWSELTNGKNKNNCLLSEF